jgi:hypothetical protein
MSVSNMFLYGVAVSTAAANVEAEKALAEYKRAVAHEDGLNAKAAASELAGDREGVATYTEMARKAALETAAALKAVRAAGATVNPQQAVGIPASGPALPAEAVTQSATVLDLLKSPMVLGGAAAVLLVVLLLRKKSSGTK